MLEKLSEKQFDGLFRTRDLANGLSAWGFSILGVNGITWCCNGAM